MVNLGPVSIKPSDRVYIVPAKTVVMVSNASNVLKDYTTKNENRFAGTCIVFSSGIRFELVNRLIGVNVTASTLHDSGYHTFMTGNIQWPYMVVKQSVFDEVDTSDLLQLTGKKQLSALTKKQENQIRKKAFCPDCLSVNLGERAWCEKDCLVVCRNCTSEFRVTDTDIERL